MTKKATILTFALLILSFILLCLLVYVDEPYDDSFISYRVANNLVRGSGLRFNPAGEKVEGFSNFFWVVILSLFSKLGFNIVNSSVILGVIFSIVSLYLSYKIARQLLLKFALAVPFFIILTDFFVVNTTSGLETSLFTFLFLLTYYFALQAFSPNYHFSKQNAYFASASLTSFLLSITRPEGPIVFVSIITFLIIKEYKKSSRFLEKFCYSFLPFVLFYLPYFWWRYNYFGYFLPNTYYARQLILFPSLQKQLSMGGFYFLTFFKDQPQLLLTILWLPLLKKKNIKKEYQLLLYILCFYLCFILAAGGDWNHMFGTWRFMMPLAPCLILLFFKELSVLTKQSQNNYRLALFLGIFIVLSQVNLTNTKKYPQHIDFEMDKRGPVVSLLLKAFKHPGIIQQQLTIFLTNQGLFHLDARTGLWLKENYPADTFLASRQAGRLAFFSDFKFLDIAGLVSEKIARFGKNDYYGKKYIDYIFEAKADCFIFPATKLKADSFFSPHLIKHGYYLSKVFCYIENEYLFKDIYEKMYTDPHYQAPDDLPIYFLCLFKKGPATQTTGEQNIKLIFEDKWYFLAEKDLVIFQETI